MLLETLGQFFCCFGFDTKSIATYIQKCFYFSTFYVNFNLKKGGKTMKSNKKDFIYSAVFLTAFCLWTYLVLIFDRKPIGLNGSKVGFATINSWFHSLTGANMILYNITDWLGLVPIFICMIFGVVGFTQLVKRKNLLKVDFDIIILGLYYIVVILSYLIFEMLPINYRPIFIDGYAQFSYPSSTTLLVLSVMPTLNFQVNRRIKCAKIKHIIVGLSTVFSVFMVVGRLISGVHWLTDIIGACLLSAGLFSVYKAVVCLFCKE